MLKSGSFEVQIGWDRLHPEDAGQAKAQPVTTTLTPSIYSSSHFSSPTTASSYHVYLCIPCAPFARRIGSNSRQCFKLRWKPVRFGLCLSKPSSRRTTDRRRHIHDRSLVYYNLQLCHLKQNNHTCWWVCGVRLGSRVMPSSDWKEHLPRQPRPSSARLDVNSRHTHYSPPPSRLA